MQENSNFFAISVFLNVPLGCGYLWYSLLINCYILRVSYVYPTYMLRISYVIGKERTARSRGQGSRIKEKYIMVDNVGMMVDNVENNSR